MAMLTIALIAIYCVGLGFFFFLILFMGKAKFMDYMAVIFWPVAVVLVIIQAIITNESFNK